MNRYNFGFWPWRPRYDKEMQPSQDFSLRALGAAGAAAQSPEAESYYRDNIHATVTSKCIDCHIDGGRAGYTGSVTNSAPGNHDVFDDFVNTPRQARANSFVENSRRLWTWGRRAGRRALRNIRNSSDTWSCSRIRQIQDRQCQARPLTSLRLGVTKAPL